MYNASGERVTRCSRRVLIKRGELTGAGRTESLQDDVGERGGRNDQRPFGEKYLVSQQGTVRPAVQGGASFTDERGRNVQDIPRSVVGGKGGEVR